MKVLKKIIIIILIVVICLIVTLLVLKSNKPSQTGTIGNEIQEEEDGGELNIEFMGSEYMQPVETHTVFYAISDCIQKYYDYISFDMSKADTEMDVRNFDAVFGEMEKITKKEDQKEAIYNLLDEEYITQKGITKENILDKIEINQPLEFYATNMKYIDGIVTRQYIVSGKVRLLADKQKSEKVFFVITLDRNSSTYMIKPIEEKYNSIDEIQVEDYQKNIKNKDDRNVIKYTTYSDNVIAQKYFDYYKNIAFYDKEEIYNLFSEEYRNKRFGSLQNFEKYIDNIAKNDKGISVQEYLVNNYEDYKEYVCKDNYGNLYVFKEKNPMDITIELDTYTLDNEKFIEKYNSSDDQYRVAMNIDKWIQMINNRDYQSAFNVLDETFRTDNFQNDVDVFEQYMRYYFPKHYKIEYGEFSEETGTYIQEITMEDITGEDTGEIKEHIYMELGEGTDFVMSFNLIGH